MADLVIRKQKCNSYSISFGGESNNYAATRQFRVYKKMICECRKNKTNLGKQPKIKKGFEAGEITLSGTRKCIT